MTDINETQRTAIDSFRSLHKSGCFVLPNPWDAGTAVYLHHLGFSALATTSAGFAFSKALPDRAAVIPLQEMLNHFREIVQATPLPVNADFQNGFGDQPEEVAKNVGLCVATGVAGLSIEDANGNERSSLYEKSLAVERIKAARAAIDSSGLPVVLTARCEVWFMGHSAPLETAMDRLVAYSEAGADCLYAPGVRNTQEISEIIKAVAPKPINVLVSAPAPDLTLARLKELGVRRISVGAALARVAWGAFIRAASTIATSGSFDGLADSSSSAELNGLFSSRL